MSDKSNEKDFLNKIKTVLFETDKKTKTLKPTPIFWLLIGACIILVSIIWFTNKNAQEIYIGNNKIGIVSGTSLTSEELTEMVIAKIQGEENTNIRLEEPLSVTKVKASKSSMITLDYALYKISRLTDYMTEAASIYVDGESIVILSTYEEAEDVLNEIKSKYINENSDFKDVSFAQNVEIVSEFVVDESISSKQVAIDLLTASTNQEKKYQIVAGDTLYQIAIDYGITLEELFKANPNITEDSILKIGQEINLVVPTPLVSVVTVEEVTYNEVIKRETETTYNDSQYKTYRKVISEGADGEKLVVADVIKVNGYEEDRKIISEDVIVEPVAQTVEVGTLNTPPKASVGNFIYPINASISSGYGYRSDGFHKGIDLTAPYGTPIKASDGGTVVYAGWSTGGYGYMVQIDHGNGFSTLYGHNSSNAVSVGQKVAQGEVIAYVGSTGNSSGNHLHFEILKNGVAQNPINYLQ